MILTGIANDNFLDWITDKYFFKGKTFSDLTIYQKGDVGQFLRYPTTKNAYIIEWLDSAGIYITIEGVFDRMLGYHRGFELHIYQDGKQSISIFNNNDVFETRIEATKAAIVKANEIYNSQDFIQ